MLYLLYLLLWLHVNAGEVAKLRTIMVSYNHIYLTLKKSQPREFVTWLTYVVNSCKSLAKKPDFPIIA